MDKERWGASFGLPGYDTIFWAGMWVPKFNPEDWRVLHRRDVSVSLPNWYTASYPIEILYKSYPVEILYKYYPI